MLYTLLWAMLLLPNAHWRLLLKLNLVINVAVGIRLFIIRYIRSVRSAELLLDNLAASVVASLGKTFKQNFLFFMKFVKSIKTFNDGASVAFSFVPYSLLVKFLPKSLFSTNLTWISDRTEANCRISKNWNFSSLDTFVHLKATFSQ